MIAPWNSHRFRWAAPVLLLAAVVPLLAQAPKEEPKPSAPADLRARSAAAVNAAFPEYVFAGKQFPAPRAEQPGKVELPLGPFTAKATFYDANYQPVTEAEKPGVYGAVVEITPREGRLIRRFVTLYRVAETPTGDNLAAAAAVPPGAVKREAALIAEVLGKRSFAEWSRDPRAARLLAGLSQDRGAGPVHKYDDAFALERQWWVGLKRKLYGWDRQFPKPVVAPYPKEGEPAPVVRTGTPAEAGMKDDAAEKIDAVLTKWGNDDDQAFAVCVVRRGVIVLHKAYGTRDGKPMTTDTKSWMASITKTMSASLMLMLVDQGLVSLDDPVEKFFPNLKGLRPENPLRIRHLYTHTGDLGDWPAIHVDDWNDVEARLADFYPRLRVGKKWAYQGSGYSLGGKIIEAVSGEAVPQFFHNHLLGPLGCDNTDVTGTHADARSVPLDMAKFGQMLLNKGAYGKHRFFKEETFKLMLPRKLTIELGPEAQKTFGFGLDGQPNRFGHGAASAATFHVDVDNELVVIMTRNKYGKNQGKYGGMFMEAIKAGMK